MHPTRMTRGLPHALAAAGWLAAAGCNASPRETATDAGTAATGTTPRGTARPEPLQIPAPRPQGPKPDPTRLAFDPSARTLTVYDLPDRSARWMLTTPAAPMGVPVDREYRFPAGMDLDLDQVAVFYTLPNSRPSAAVSLQEILDSRGVRAQR